MTTTVGGRKEGRDGRQKRQQQQQRDERVRPLHVQHWPLLPVPREPQPLPRGRCGCRVQPATKQPKPKVLARFIREPSQFLRRRAVLFVVLRAGFRACAMRNIIWYPSSRTKVANPSTQRAAVERQQACIQTITLERQGIKLRVRRKVRNVAATRASRV